MQQESKIKLLLNQLNIPESHMLYQYLNGAEIEKVAISRTEKTWNIYLNIEKLLPVALYLELLSFAEQNFPYILKFSFTLAPTYEIRQQELFDYFHVLVQENHSGTAFLETAMQFTFLHFHEGILHIHCGDTYHLLKWQEHQKIMKEALNRLGLAIQLEIALSEVAEEKFENLKKENVDAQKILEKEEKKRIIQKQNVGGGTSQPQKKKINAATTLSKKIFEKQSFIHEAHHIGEQVLIEGYVFDKEVRKTKNGKFIMTLKVTDYTDSIYVSKWLQDESECEEIQKGTWVYFFGKLEIDPYRHNERVIRLQKYEIFEKPVKKDDAPKKRIELHAHTKMSQLDGVVAATDLVKQAIQFDHDAIAITDHAVVHSFPDAFHASGKNQKTKVLYGCEFNVVDYSETDIYYEELPVEVIEDFDEKIFIVFDVETTGFSPNYNKLIELAAIKIKQGTTLDVFESFINPDELLSQKTTELTSIQQRDVDHAPGITTFMKQFMEWCGDLSNVIFVAHNAHFDIRFIKAIFFRLFDKELRVNYLDSLQLARHLYPNIKRHGLKAMTKYFAVKLDQHHRAIADTRATVEVFLHMLHEMRHRGYKNISDFNKIVTKERAHEIDYSYHITVLAKNQMGLKNLFKLVSKAHIDYFVREARIPLSVLLEHREGLLWGSACQNNEIFQAVLNQSDDEVIERMQKYDYIEIQPPQHYQPLLDMGTIPSKEQLHDILKKVIDLAKKAEKIVVVTGDVHQLEEKDTLLRKIYIDTQTGVHPLARNGIKSIPAMYLMTTEEMIDAFSFLGNQELIEEIVIDNTHIIADQIEAIEVIKNELFTPKMDNVDDNVRIMVWKKAKEIYGENLPEVIVERLEKELKSIIGHGFAVIYYICHKIVKKSLEDGYIVGSRGSVGSSLVATMMEITEVNPLAPHYICPKCHYIEFHGGVVGSGFDLADKACPQCGHALKKDGHDIPFETFLGFEGDKVPDIDLNFSGEYQPIAHDYTKVLFGEEYVYRAGTISTIADKTAYGYVRNFANDHPEMGLSNLEVDRLTQGVAGVKKTTGRHAGGIIVVPNDMEIYDITPIQYPADGKTGKDWRTTHFDFHAIHDNLLKLDLLGHDDPTIIRMLQDLSGMKPQEIPIDDPLVYSLFSSTEALNLQKPIFSKTGSLGLPEFGTEFVRQMLEQTNPKSFSELLQISGLSHGTDVWLNNAQKLVQSGVCELKDVIGCRDDIMVYLIYKGLQPADAFKIMELTRKGQFSRTHEEYIEKMYAHDVPEWYIDSCLKIKYMFPKAHAAAYVMMAIRIAWFKVHHPIYFYASLFSVRGKGKTFEIETILGGYETVKARIEAIVQNPEPTNRDIDTKVMLELVLEMLARGYSFKNVDLMESHPSNFLVKDNELVFPFQAVDGLGENVALAIVEQRAVKPFLSKEDLRKRTSISKTVMAKLEIMQVLTNLEDQNQMSLF